MLTEELRVRVATIEMQRIVLSRTASSNRPSYSLHDCSRHGRLPHAELLISMRETVMARTNPCKLLHRLVD